MQSKNKPAPTKEEKEHIERIASMPCVVCEKAPPSEVHEPIQGAWWLSIPLCALHHRDEKQGLHGARFGQWKLNKWDQQPELWALNETVRRLMIAARNARAAKG
jgi:hypothetical protein